MQEIRCKECGRIIAMLDGDEIIIRCPHAGKRQENGYIYGNCKTENRIKMNVRKENVKDDI